MYHIQLGKNQSLISALRDIFNGDYIRSAWQTKKDGKQLQSDITFILGNLAVVATLFCAASLSMFLMTHNLNFGSDVYKYIYGAVTWCSTLLSIMTVILCFRILIAIQLMDEEEIGIFVHTISNVLIKPLKYNFIAIACLPLSLLTYSVDKFGWLFTGITAGVSIVIYFVFAFLQTARTVQVVTEITIQRGVKLVSFD